MIRLLWLALSAAAATFLASPATQALRPLLEHLAGAGMPPQGLAALTATLAMGVLIFGLLGFVAPALFEGVQVARARQRINQLADGSIPGHPVARDELSAAFEGASFLDRAAEIASVSHIAAGDEDGKVHATCPAERCFGPGPLVDDRLLPWLFTPLPLFLAGVGVTAAALALVQSAGAPAQTATAAWSFALPVLAGVILHLLTRLVLGWRRMQAVGLCHRLDNLLYLAPSPVASLENLRHEMVAASRDQAAVLEQTLRDPLARLTEASVRLSEDQSAQVQQLLRTTLKSFVSEVQDLTGQQARDLHGILKESGNLAQKLERSLTDSARTLSKFSKTQSADMTEALEQYRAALTSFEEKSRQTFSAELKLISEKIDQSAAHIRDASLVLKDAGSDGGSFKAALAPLFDELLATQKALLFAIESQKATALPPLRLPERQDPPPPQAQPEHQAPQDDTLEKLKSMSRPPAFLETKVNNPELATDFGKLRATIDGSLPEL